MSEQNTKLEVFIEKLLECGNYRVAAEFAGYAADHGRKLYKNNLEEIQARMSEKMTLMQVQAMNIVEETMTHEGAIKPKQDLKLNAAKDVMDRGGLAKRQAIDMAVSELPAVMQLPAKAPKPSQEDS